METINWDSLSPAQRNELVCKTFNVPGEPKCGLSVNGGESYFYDSPGDPAGVQATKLMQSEMRVRKDNKYASAEFFEWVEYPPVTEYPALAVDLLEEQKANCDVQLRENGWTVSIGEGYARSVDFSQAVCMACLGYKGVAVKTTVTK